MATAETATKARAARKPSPFTPTVKVTVTVHSSIDPLEAGVSIVGDIFEKVYGPSFAVRAVSRSRGDSHEGPPSLMVYLAPKGYEFPKSTERGVRLDAETANLLRGIASSMGLDPNDSASIVAVAKALALKVAK